MIDPKIIPPVSQRDSAHRGLLVEAEHLGEVERVRTVGQGLL
ncbi:hypothetical protein PV367_25600 [Streptomyces europaeiscabiei]|uniref:Uncharacterized protein n=1 Tax=Streptomyces europaeiscabiei TaxID=146819 RepID=A0AAJ2PTR4_9ACTN|nr:MULTISPECIES: hypothetical protein [Streptomyces]MDX3133071.1 hypothetical protein [Streptomyces europaeiscabiei]